MAFRTAAPQILAMGVAAAVVLGGCGSSSGSDTGTSAPPSAKSTSTGASGGGGGGAVKSGTAEVVYKDILIHPEKITLKVGTKVTWVSKDSTPHNVTFKPGDPAEFTSKDLNKGDTATFTFEKPGTYNYLCTFHPASMQGVITVKP